MAIRARLASVLQKRQQANINCSLEGLPISKPEKRDMTVVRQSQWEDLDGFQVDWKQFSTPYDLGCDVVDAFCYSLDEACEVEDQLTVCAIVRVMLMASGLYLPPMSYACYCDPWEVGCLVKCLRFEAVHGDREELHKLLIEAALAAGIYGSHGPVPPQRPSGNGCI